jgi:cytochrome c
MKFILIIAVVIVFASCGAGTGETSASDSADATRDLVNVGVAIGGDSASISAGGKLIAGNDCLTCHHIDKKSVGPSYRQIAEKYDLNQGNIENLATAIIKGSKGLWGNAAMTPHPRLSNEEAEAMCRYILSLRNNADSLK